MATRMRDGALLEAKKAKLKPPPLFKVILLNDDYTPMEFVVIVLQRFFSMTREKAGKKKTPGAAPKAAPGAW